MLLAFILWSLAALPSAISGSATKSGFLWQENSATVCGEYEDGLNTLVDVTTTTDGYFVSVGYGNTSCLGNAGAWHLLAVAYSSDGELQWTQEYDHSDDSAVVIPVSIAKTDDGGVVVCGYTDGTAYNDTAGGTDAIVVRLDSSGVVLWSWQGGSAGDDACASVVQSPKTKEIFFGLHTDGSLSDNHVDGQYDMLLGLLDDRNGDFREYWKVGNSSVDIVPTGLAAFSSGDLVIAGFAASSQGSSGVDTMFAKRLNLSGVGIATQLDTAWERELGKAQSTDNRLVGLVIDVHEDVLLAGQAAGSGWGTVQGSTDFVVLKLDGGDGEQICFFEAGTSRGDWPTSIALDSDGTSVYVSGFTEVTLGASSSDGEDPSGYAGLVVKFSTDCQTDELNWWIGPTVSTAQAAAEGQNRFVTGITVGTDSEVIVCGFTSNGSISRTYNTTAASTPSGGTSSLLLGQVPYAGSYSSSGKLSRTDVELIIGFACAAGSAIIVAITWAIWWTRKRRRLPLLPSKSANTSDTSGVAADLYFRKRGSVWTAMVADNQGDATVPAGNAAVTQDEGNIKTNEQPSAKVGGIIAGGFRKRKNAPTATSSSAASAQELDVMSEFEISASALLLQAKLGEGYFGTVYRGRWQGQKVAVKKLRQTVDLRSLRHEIACLSRLRHPNVCFFYGCTKPPVCLIVSELLWGSLYKLLHKEDHKPLSNRGRFRVIKDIARGLAYIHSRGFVHRDVSSSNVLLTGDSDHIEQVCASETDDPVAKISDFGLSRPTDSAATLETGNFFYLAPEVYRGQQSSEKSDVYAYALLMWEIYTRKKPFSGYSPQLAAFNAAEKNERPPLDDSIATGVALLMQDCWHADAEFRPHLKEVLDALEEMEAQWVRFGRPTAANAANGPFHALNGGSSVRSDDSNALTSPAKGTSSSNRKEAAALYGCFDDDDDVSVSDNDRGRTTSFSSAAPAASASADAAAAAGGRFEECKERHPAMEFAAESSEPEEGFSRAYRVSGEANRANGSSQVASDAAHSSVVASAGAGGGLAMPGPVERQRTPLVRLGDVGFVPPAAVVQGRGSFTAWYMENERLKGHVSAPSSVHLTSASPADSAPRPTPPHDRRNSKA